jgi:hypothetical protein
MAMFTTAVAPIPGAKSVFDGLSAHLVANGWTKHDILVQTVTGASWALGVATITATNTYVVGQTVEVSGITPAGYNGTFIITVAAAGSFKYALPSDPGAWAVGGAASVGSTVFKGGAFDATAGNAPFIFVGVLDPTTLYFLAYTDWETATHTGANVAGASANSYLNVTNADCRYLIRANSVSFYILVKSGAGATISTTLALYAGFLRRHYGPGKSGMTKTTAGYAIGIASLAVASDMQGKIRVGQYIDILNYDHTAGANFANGEKVQVTSVAAGAIGITALTKAYGAGALVGANVYPIVVTAPSAGPNATSTPYSCLHPDGSRTSAIGQTGTAVGSMLAVYSSNDPGNLDFLRAVGPWEVSSSVAAKLGARGVAYHVQTISHDHGFEDIVKDGDGTTDWITTGCHTSQGTAMKRGG